jgi:hypothetical protein
MNNTFKVITTLVLAAGLVGCATTSQNSAEQLAVEQQLITDAAQVGTALALQHNPGYAVDFSAGEQVLDSIATGTNSVSGSTVEQALATAGTVNPTVTIAVTDALGLADAWIAAQGTNAATVQAVCSWIATGIGEGLSLQTKGSLTLKK